MNTITSSNNPLIKKVSQLQHKKYRFAYNQFVAEGIRVCSTLINSPQKLIYCFVTEQMKNHASFIPQNNIIIVTEQVMKKISSSSTPSGLLCVFELPSQQQTIPPGHALVCAQISDPGNLGTLMRTACAMNINHIICVDSVDPWNPKVVQSTAGTIGRLNIFTWQWKKLLYNKRDAQLCALVISDSSSIKHIAIKKPIYLVVGNEAHGIPSAWIADCDLTVTIFMPGKTESLNASIAGAIALYELAQKT